MEEVIGMVKNKLAIYSNFYEKSKELKQIDNQRYYSECIDKLNKTLEILTKQSNEKERKTKRERN